jgi:hypothetical protein
MAPSGGIPKNLNLILHLRDDFGSAVRSPNAYRPSVVLLRSYAPQCSWELKRSLICSGE